MPYLNDYVYDNGLNYLDTATLDLHICSQEPTTYAQATSTYTLGNKAGVSVGAPDAGSPNGRKVTVAAITGGTTTGTGNATHYALVEPSNSRLVAANALSGGGQAVTAGNPWDLAAFNIRIPAAVSE